MIVAFSTSSVWASTALLAEDGTVLWSACEKALHRASGTCLKQLESGLAETGLDLAQVSLFAADLGPGSFTGVRVGIVLAKTLAYANGKLCVGADAFDLVAPDQVVVFPSRKGEFFVREPGQAPVRQIELPEGSFVGFGYGGPDRPPEAARFGHLLDRLKAVPAEELVPAYLIDPSISIPKKPYKGVPSV